MYLADLTKILPEPVKLLYGNLYGILSNSLKAFFQLLESHINRCMLPDYRLCDVCVNM